MSRTARPWPRHAGYRRLPIPFIATCRRTKRSPTSLPLPGPMPVKGPHASFRRKGCMMPLDPVMSSAYTGVAGSFVVVAVQENAEEVTPLGIFSKLPLIVTETEDELKKAVSYAFSISEEYKIPVIVQAFPGGVRRRSCRAPQRKRLQTVRPHP